MHPMLSFLVVAGAMAGATVPVLDDAGLQAVLERRLTGDRTGACFAAAVIGKTVSRAVFCADATKSDGVDSSTAFEIGSVTKTMTAALAAGLIAEDRLALDAPLTEYLPKGTKVPDFEGQPIRIRHLMTHTSGLPALPARLAITSMDDPYARLTEAELYGSLADVRLNAAPGTHFAYSNYAVMLLSDIVARQSGKPFDELIAERLFLPLDMRNSFVRKPGKGTRVAGGHLQTGAKASVWNFPRNYAGVGGVRASLDDMVHYVQAQLGQRESSADAAIAMTQQQLADVPGAKMAMNWKLMPYPDGVVHAHEGGTGGFSSLVAFDRKQGRGVVILSDTALTAVGGLGRLGMYLLDGSAPLESPRLVATASAELLDALSGDFMIDGGLKMKVTHEHDQLVIQALGQSAYKMGFDSSGDFYPLDFDALLRPKRQADGSYTFTWFQAGAEMAAKRLSIGTAAKPARAAIALNADQRAQYPGDYPLAPGFVLAVINDDDKLFVQGTGQSRIEVVPVDKDVFVADSVGAEIVFERDASGKVTALVLHQAGQKLRGVRQ
jgi:serine-type D-Ala-D-Ala carboxypeptidase/endopeptidase